MGWRRCHVVLLLAGPLLVSCPGCLVSFDATLLDDDPPVPDHGGPEASLDTVTVDAAQPVDVRPAEEAPPKPPKDVQPPPHDIQPPPHDVQPPPHDVQPVDTTVDTTVDLGPDLTPVDTTVDTTVDLGPDLTPQDQATDAICSPKGILTTCDPLADTGCTSGACYIARSSGTGCVCPLGTAGAGDPCNSTTDCLPKHVCAGATAPGTCRPLCDPATPACTDPLATCTQIAILPGLGFCDPGA